MNSGAKKALVVAFICGAVVFFAWYKGLHHYVTIEALRANRASLEQAVEHNYGKSVALYLAVYILVIALALPGVPVLTLLGGFLFGFLPTVLYASVAATIGSTLSFLVIRYLLSNLIRGKYAQRLETFNEKIRSHGVAHYLLTLQLVGIIPYFVINTLAALADVPLATFLWTTYVGSCPILLIYSLAGRQLYQIHSVQDIFSPSIIGLLLVLVLLALMPLFLRFSRRVTDL